MFQLKNTPFHERTSALCLPQNWRKWAGYYVVRSYEHTIDREYWATRNAAALIDVTPLIKYIIKGKDAAGRPQVLGSTPPRGRDLVNGLRAWLAA